MDDVEKQKLIKKLKESRENVNVLLNMLKREKSDLEHEIRLAGETKWNLNEVLFGLTGDVFYKNT